tara:strand:- start:841 stop:1011 length:171 start_codon:yes stop_codon:yes gene_type:complete
MTYIIKAFKKGKQVGVLRDNNGKTMKFKSRQEAQTTANIESTQMESEGHDLRVAKI